MSDNSPKKPVAENHYLAGRKAWSEMYGSFIEERNSWRIMAIGCALLAILLAGANILQLTQAKVIPFVVEVDRAGRISGTVMAQELETTPAVIRYSIASFITAWRTVTADITLQERYVQQASFMSIGSAHGLLADWYAYNNPYVASVTKLVQVKINALPLFISGNTWLVEWQEIERNHQGELQSTTTFQANLVIARHPPETKQQILRNASGIFILEIRYSEKRV